MAIAAQRHHDVTMPPASQQQFLAAYGWADATISALPADWSQRHFARLTNKKSETAFLMRDPAVATVQAYVRISQIIRALGLSAPQVLASDSAGGWVLLEDFGDRNMGRLIDAGAPAAPLLMRALDALIVLQRTSKQNPGLWQGLPLYDGRKFIELLDPFITELVPARFGLTPADEERQQFAAAWQATLQPYLLQPMVLMHRDFMADNVMDLPTKTGVQAVGLLDFDLAGKGPMFYDLASLTEQVRRDYSDNLREEILTHYLAAFPEIKMGFLRQAVAVFAAQRHLRIMALLQRFAHQPQHAAKRAMLQRVHRHIAQLLRHQALGPVHEWFCRYLPAFLSPDKL